VLSACQTAIQDFSNLPDEAIGLPAGLTQAGVPSVLGTLWSVNDASTGAADGAVLRTAAAGPAAAARGLAAGATLAAGRDQRRTGRLEPSRSDCAGSAAAGGTYADDEAGQKLLDHDFLCLQFDFARWVRPAASPAAAEIAVEALACIVPSDSGLAEAQQERDDLHALAAAAG